MPSKEEFEKKKKFDYKKSSSILLIACMTINLAA
jgi:hypothetical protein